MRTAELLAALEAHPMSGWQRPSSCALPALAPHGRLIWCGIGGSLLPAESLVRALGDTEHQERFLPLASPEPQVVSLGPTDQLVFASKSGRTLELWTWLGRLRALPGFRELARPPIAITQDDQNPLARLARAEGWPILPIPESVGGRYSAFTAIGALPIAWLGLDPDRFIEGARAARAQVDGGDGVWGQRVLQTVQAWLEGWQRSIELWVLLPYANHLEPVGAWWVQLVAESLGKLGADGHRRGITPIRAVGPQDQHAQLQRWLDGPRNVGVVLATVSFGLPADPCDLPSQCPYPGLESLGGCAILRAQADGTREALRAAGVPVLQWDLGPLDEAELGALFMAWQMIVALTGFGLGVNPFDQPAVEDGKRRTLNLLGLG